MHVSYPIPASMVWLELVWSLEPNDGLWSGCWMLAVQIQCLPGAVPFEIRPRGMLKNQPALHTWLPSGSSFLLSFTLLTLCIKVCIRCDMRHCLRDWVTWWLCCCCFLGYQIVWTGCRCSDGEGSSGLDGASAPAGREGPSLWEGPRSRCLAVFCGRDRFVPGTPPACPVLPGVDWEHPPGRLAWGADVRKISSHVTKCRRTGHSAKWSSYSALAWVGTMAIPHQSQVVKWSCIHLWITLWIKHWMACCGSACCGCRWCRRTCCFEGPVKVTDFPQHRQVLLKVSRKFVLLWQFKISSLQWCTKR